MFETALSAFVALFVVIDPIGLTPMFIALTHGATPKERRGIAIRGALVAALILLVFGLAGKQLLELLGVGIPAFRIAGGALLFLIAIEMLFEKRTERRNKTAEDGAAEAAGLDHDPSVFPLALPLIAGPGAMAAMILLMGEQAGSFLGQAVIIGMMLLVVGMAFLLFLASGIVARVIGETGVTVVTRVLGMLLAALSVQFMLDGLTAYGLFTTP